jgi:hypothetical protein
MQGKSAASRPGHPIAAVLRLRRRVRCTSVRWSPPSAAILTPAPRRRMAAAHRRRRPARTLPGAADEHPAHAGGFGFEWDGEVLVQSRRLDLYHAALTRLQLDGEVYPCACSRREIAACSPPGGRWRPGLPRNLPCRFARDARTRLANARSGPRDRIRRSRAGTGAAESRARRRRLHPAACRRPVCLPAGGGRRRRGAGGQRSRPRRRPARLDATPDLAAATPGAADADLRTPAGGDQCRRRETLQTDARAAVDLRVAARCWRRR